jgi:hypothetical protein
MQEFGPISSRVYIVFFPAQPIAMFKLSICSSYGWITQPQTIVIGYLSENTIHT